MGQLLVVTNGYENLPISLNVKLKHLQIALAASNQPDAESALRQAAENDPEPLVREHADWALQ